jgi:hypothetical protein
MRPQFKMTIYLSLQMRQANLSTKTLFYAHKLHEKQCKNHFRQQEMKLVLFPSLFINIKIVFKYIRVYNDSYIIVLLHNLYF